MKLESRNKRKYGAEYNSAVLEQWKTCVDSANNNTEKRNSANTLFITINVALCAAVSFSWDYKSIFLAVVGIVVCILWLNSIRSYRQLSSVKYQIINDIEKKLPLAPFTYEWEILKKDSYVGLTTIEKLLPWIFIVMYAIAILVPTVKMVVEVICPCTGGAA